MPYRALLWPYPYRGTLAADETGLSFHCDSHPSFLFSPSINFTAIRRMSRWQLTLCSSNNSPSIISSDVEGCKVSHRTDPRLQGGDAHSEVIIEHAHLRVTSPSGAVPPWISAHSLKLQGPISVVASRWRVLIDALRAPRLWHYDSEFALSLRRAT